MKNGHPIAAGELFVQTDLARTLTTIARDGADVFYRGALARKSADFYAEQGGLLSKDDLAKYVAEQAEPIHTAYAGLDVYQSAPNSQGIVMLIAINILEGYDLEALGHNSVEYLHEYFLNNRTPYFSLEEDYVNVLVPGKRTRHTVNPALALKDGKPYLAWNTPGGDNQPQAMLQAFLAIVHFGANVQQAVEAATVTSVLFAPRCIREGFAACSRCRPGSGSTRPKASPPRAIASKCSKRSSPTCKQPRAPAR